MRNGVDPNKPTLLPVPISLTRRGLPRTIPPFYRSMIRSGGPKVVKCYLSFFSLYRIILLAKLIDKTTFSSIVTPVQDMHRVYSTISRMKENVVGALVSPVHPMVSTHTIIPRHVVGTNLEDRSNYVTG